MTLAELEEIAIEAGIDPRHLRRAAQDPESGDRDEAPSFWAKVVGERLQLSHEAVVPGEIDETGFERVVGVIQRVAKEHGQPSLLGRTLTWRAETPNKSRTIQVVVSARGGETRIRVDERLHQFAAGLFGGSVTGLGLGAGIGIGVPLSTNVLGSVLFGVAFPIGMVGLTFIGAREVYRASVRSRTRALDTLLGHIVAEVRQRVAPPARSGEAPSRGRESGL